MILDKDKSEKNNKQKSFNDLQEEWEKKCKEQKSFNDLKKKMFEEHYEVFMLNGFVPYQYSGYSMIVVSKNIEELTYRLVLQSDWRNKEFRLEIKFYLKDMVDYPRPFLENQLVYKGYVKDVLHLQEIIDRYRLNN